MTNLPSPYEVIYGDDAKKALDKMNPNDRKRIISAIDRFAATATPRPKPLSYEFKNEWRIRVGKRRVVFEYLDYEINDLPAVLITIIEHRNKV
ncbi:MAG: hypothetical protein LBQ52_07005 [Helicobacteraceae bacterium]|jgi:mRNA-degrading endonuclease RelE of RelBE toxin-antitoxin system|nr:hypothetical protein [Helicobacteraceae bacterium]